MSVLNLTTCEPGRHLSFRTDGVIFAHPAERLDPRDPCQCIRDQGLRYPLMNSANNNFTAIERAFGRDFAHDVVATFVIGKGKVSNAAIEAFCASAIAEALKGTLG